MEGIQYASFGKLIYGKMKKPVIFVILKGRLRRGREGGQIVTLTGALARAAVELTQSFQVQLSSRGINISGEEMRRMLKIEMRFFLLFTE